MICAIDLLGFVRGFDRIFAMNNPENDSRQELPYHMLFGFIILQQTEPKVPYYVVLDSTLLKFRNQLGHKCHDMLHRPRCQILCGMIEVNT